MTRGKRITKKCKYCNKDFEALLIKIRVGKAKYCSRECVIKYQKENAKDTKYMNSVYQRKHKYGISEEEYLLMFEKQNNECKICKKNFDNTKVNIDHSHITGEIRGLLCDGCNRGLGSFYDNIQYLNNAIRYLKEQKV